MWDTIDLILSTGKKEVMVRELIGSKSKKNNDEKTWKVKDL